MPHSLIWEHMIYKFKLGHNATDVIKNICYRKGESAVDHGIVSRWFKKFYPDCKNHDGYARSDRPKTMDSKAPSH